MPRPSPPSCHSGAQQFLALSFNPNRSVSVSAPPRMPLCHEPFHSLSLFLPILFWLCLSVFSPPSLLLTPVTSVQTANYAASSLECINTYQVPDLAQVKVHLDGANTDTQRSHSPIPAVFICSNKPSLVKFLVCLESLRH